MTWPRSTRFGFGRNAATAGRKGGRAVRTTGVRRSLEYTKGYAAGWLAATRHPRKVGT